MKYLLFLTLCLGGALAAHFQVPMHKVPASKAADVTRHLKNKSLAARYASQLSTGSQAISDWVDCYYVMNATLGTPPQPFQLLLDTSFSTLWVVDSSCTSSQCNGNTKGWFPWKKQKYNRSKSSTFKKDGKYIEFPYGPQKCTGHQAIDDLSFGGFTVKSQTFGAMESISVSLADFPYDGVFGLGMPKSALNGITPPFQNLIPQLDAGLFTVYLERHVKPENALPGGLITYGAVDTTNCDASITYTPVTSDAFWQFQISSLTVGKYVNARSVQAVSDTGIPFLLGPQKDVDQIVRLSNAQFQDQYGMYTIDCDSLYNLPDIVFKVNGVDLVIPSIEHAVRMQFVGNDVCALGVSDISGVPFDWLLGQPFVRTYCNVYDFAENKIGFSKAHQQEA